MQSRPNGSRLPLYLPFAQHWFAVAQASLVASEDPLPDVERFRVGGPTSVRAYAASEVAGDEGNPIRLDVGRQFSLGEKTRMIVKLFADTGTVERINLRGESDDETLDGYGVGALVNIGRIHTIEVEAVEATSDFESADGEDSRVWFNYTAQF